MQFLVRVDPWSVSKIQLLDVVHFRTIIQVYHAFLPNQGHSIVFFSGFVPYAPLPKGLQSSLVDVYFIPLSLILICYFLACVQYDATCCFDCTVMTNCRLKHSLGLHCQLLE